jgi:protein-S-isoprenylcysteine O-methyltransferase Ste14
MQIRTLGWLACVVYSTIPLLWLMIHPQAHRWRACQASPFRTLIPIWFLMWVGMAALTSPWRIATFYSTPWTWIPAALLFATGIFIYSTAGSPFSWAQLSGLPEVRAGRRDDRLITTGIRSRVRHPVYLGHLCEMLAWSIGTGLLACWLLTAFAIIAGAVMIHLEDAELERRFGADYVTYRQHVRGIFPKLFIRSDHSRPSRGLKI